MLIANPAAPITVATVRAIVAQRERNFSWYSCKCVVFSEFGFIIAVVDPTTGLMSSGIGLVRMFVINLESVIIKRVSLRIVNDDLVEDVGEENGVLGKRITFEHNK